MKHRFPFRLLVFLALAGAVIVLYASGAGHWLNITQLKAHRDAWLALVHAHFLVALICSLTLYTLLVAISLPIADALTLLCGMLFGVWTGTLVVVIAASLGSTLALLLIRYLAADVVRARIRAKSRTQRFLDGFNRHADSYLLFMRLVPVFPFWLVNIVVALTDIPAWRFLLFTLIGILPGSFVYANVGANIARIDSMHDMVSPRVLLALGLLALLSLLPMFVRVFLRQRALIERSP